MHGEGFRSQLHQKYKWPLRQEQQHEESMINKANLQRIVWLDNMATGYDWWTWQLNTQEKKLALFLLYFNAQSMLLPQLRWSTGAHTGCTQ